MSSAGPPERDLHLAHAHASPSLVCPPCSLILPGPPSLPPPHLVRDSHQPVQTCLPASIHPHACGSCEVSGRDFCGGVGTASLGTQGGGGPSPRAAENELLSASSGAVAVVGKEAQDVEAHDPRSPGLDRRGGAAALPCQPGTLSPALDPVPPVSLAPRGTPLAGNQTGENFPGLCSVPTPPGEPQAMCPKPRGLPGKVLMAPGLEAPGSTRRDALHVQQVAVCAWTGRGPGEGRSGDRPVAQKAGRVVVRATKSGTPPGVES